MLLRGGGDDCDLLKMVLLVILILGVLFLSMVCIVLEYSIAGIK